MNPAVELLRQPKNRPRAIRLLEALLAEDERERARHDAEQAERLMAAARQETINHEAENARCAADVVYWINNWVWTYDPRRIGRVDPETGQKVSAFVQFKLWPKQTEAVHWMEARLAAEEQGVWDKSRDAGATYLAAAFALHRWLYEPGFKATFGSRDEALVDDRDNPDSIFEKLRIMLRRLPEWMTPPGFSWRAHDNKMRLVNPDNSATIIGEGGDEMGRGGRAQPLTAKVLTPSGWRTMGEIQPGDMVIGANGAPTRVVSVHPQGIRPLFRVTMSDGATTECCDDHLWQVTNRACRKVLARSGNRTYGARHHVLPLSEIRSSLRVKRPDGQTELQYRVPMLSAPDMTGDGLPLHPYVIGSLLGDGSVSQIKRTSPGFTTADAESVDTIRALLPAGFDIRSDGTAYGYRIVARDGGRHGPRVRGAVKQALVDLGMAGHSAASKSIPRACMTASAADRLELLRGLLDTDGWAGVRKSNRASAKVCFATISDQLARDVVDLVRSLGGTAMITTRPGITREFPGGRVYACKMSYQVTIAMPHGMNPFKLARKAALYQDRTKYRPTRRIASVERTEDGEAKCITVEAADGLYVTDDYIVTHNSSVYFVDEASFVRRAEGVEAALSGNTDCVIWISSANGMGNLFYRKVMAFPERQKFRLHYSDDPRKTPEWIAAKRATMDAVAWASEYEIDYAASMEGICIPAAWVQAAQKLAALEPNLKPAVRGRAGVDIGGGKAKSVVVPRHGPVVGAPHYRQGADTTETAYWALEACKETGCADLNFDAPGIGAGVASTLSKAEGYPGIVSHPVNTGLPPTDRVWPDERTSQQMFGNLKAELWWLARTAFQKTYWHVQHLLGEEGFLPQPLDELVALPADNTLATQLSMVRWFRNEAGKIVIETKAQLQKRSVPSPDFADALMLSYLEPATDDGLGDLSGMGAGDFARENPWAV